MHRQSKLEMTKKDLVPVKSRETLTRFLTEASHLCLLLLIVLRLFHIYQTKLSNLQWTLSQIPHYQGHLLPDFPPLTEHKLCNLTILTQDISKSVKNLDFTKVTGPDKIPVIVLKYLKPELSPILVKFFNCCLKEKFSQVCGQMFSVFKNVREHLFLTQYCHISLLGVIS